MALEVVDRRGDDVAGLLVGTDGVDLVAHGEQDLKRDHDFVVFDEVAGDEEDFLGGHLLRRAVRYFDRITGLTG